MKIGIFGGSFNPPHNMHKNITLELIKNGYVDKIIYVPTGDSYNKYDLISFKDRYNMVKLMIKNNDCLSISDVGNNEEYKYTYQTLDYFQNIYKDDEIYFICGDDNFSYIDKWKRGEYILSNYKIIVIKRNNLLKHNYIYKSNILFSSIKPHILSSTEIRKKISDGDNISNLIDSNVLEYIEKNKLYC